MNTQRGHLPQTEQNTAVSKGYQVFHKLARPLPQKYNHYQVPINFSKREKH